MDRITRAHRAQQLRQTDFVAEKRLWAGLRGRRLAGLKFRRQHPIAGYFADFACEAVRLVVEVDGLSHDVEGQAARDAERQAHIEAAGWHVLRVRNRDVLERLDAVLAEIQRVASAMRA